MTLYENEPHPCHTVSRAEDFLAPWRRYGPSLSTQKSRRWFCRIKYLRGRRIQPRAQAVAIADGRFLAVNSSNCAFPHANRKFFRFFFYMP
jgi:hypothetical protein